VDPVREAACAFVGAVTEAAGSLAEHVEQRLHRDSNWSEKPRVEILWTCLMYVLHLTDRVAFAHLSVETCDLFMSGILETLAATVGEGTLRNEYNTAQRRYSAFKKLLPEEGQGTTGTLCWEFAKAICFENSEMNPAIIVSLSLRAADTFEALDETFIQCVLKRIALEDKE